MVGKAHVWFEGSRLCAVMPALILYKDVFEPMWRDGMVSDNIVCINAPKSGRAVVRSGKGFGRKGSEKYYFVDFEARAVKRVKHRAVKKLYGGWMTCIELGVDFMCFEWRDGVYGVARIPDRFVWKKD